MILAVAGIGANAPAQAEMMRRVSLGDVGAGVQEQSYLALRCLELAPGRERIVDLAPWGRRDAAPAEDVDGMPAPVYGFAFASEDDDTPACATKQARQANTGA